MRKLITLLFLVSTFISFAQEIHGISTKMVEYVGDRYEYVRYDVGREYSNEYEGIEFTNHNSIPVSLVIEIFDKFSTKRYSQEYTETRYETVPGEFLRRTEGVVLQPNSTYLLKGEEFKKYPYGYTADFTVKFKAYKLE